MYNDYRDTGLFSGALLRKVADATGARYVAQLKLQGFEQGSRDRFGIFGIRIVENKYAHIRLFRQIWDSRGGSIAWEGMQELRQATDTTTEEPVMLRTVLERTARDLIARLPSCAPATPPCTPSPRSPSAARHARASRASHRLRSAR